MYRITKLLKNTIEVVETNEKGNIIINTGLRLPHLSESQLKYKDPGMATHGTTTKATWEPR